MKCFAPRRCFGRSLSTPGALLERLEDRTLLSLDNFPTTGDLVDANDTVVRLQTNLGDIDFELFDQVASGTVANFLSYLRDGDYDKTFFHRLARDEQSDPFMLQGGGYRLHGPTTMGPFNGASAAMQAWESIPVGPAITNRFNRSNLARTVAMARVGGMVNSATSQFFINLQDNQFLDTVDGGYTVFGQTDPAHPRPNVRHQDLSKRLRTGRPSHADYPDE